MLRQTGAWFCLEHSDRCFECLSVQSTWELTGRNYPYGGPCPSIVEACLGLTTPCECLMKPLGFGMLSPRTCLKPDTLCVSWAEAHKVLKWWGRLSSGRWGTGGVWCIYQLQDLPWVWPFVILSLITSCVYMCVWYAMRLSLEVEHRKTVGWLAYSSLSALLIKPDLDS